MFKISPKRLFLQKFSWRILFFRDPRKGIYELWESD